MLVCSIMRVGFTVNTSSEGHVRRWLQGMVGREDRGCSIICRGKGSKRFQEIKKAMKTGQTPGVWRKQESRRTEKEGGKTKPGNTKAEARSNN